MANLTVDTTRYTADSTALTADMTQVSYVDATEAPDTAAFVGGTTKTYFFNGDPNIVFSNGFLTATDVGGTIGNYQNAYTQTTRGATKVYAEVHSDVKLFSGSTGLGISNLTGEVPGHYLGQSNNSFGWYDNGAVYFNNAQVATFPSWSQGDVLALAVDRVAGTMQGMNITTGSAWSSTLDVSALTSSDIKFAVSVSSNTEAWTANFDGFFRATPPASGYTRWDGSVAAFANTGTMAPREVSDNASMGQFGTLTGYLIGLGSATFPTHYQDFTGASQILANVGDLIYVEISEANGPTTTTCTDIYGNTYSSVQAATASGSVSGRAFYSIVTNPGDFSAFNVGGNPNPITVNNSGSNSGRIAGIAAIIRGPFSTTSVPDANPTNITTSTSSPFTCPATGTLNSANEVVMAWGASNNANWSATSPNQLVATQGSTSTINATLGYQRVSATTSVTPQFTAGTNPTNAVLGTTSFKAPDPLPIGTLATTEATDTAAFSGQVQWFGTLAATEGADVSAISGLVGLLGAFASTEGTDTASGFGLVAWSAAFAVTEGTDTANFTAFLPNTGSMATTEGSDTAAWAGAGVLPTGPWASTELPDTAAFAGAVQWLTSFALTEASDTAAFAVMAQWVTSFALTEQPDVAAMTGTVFTGVVANWASTEPADTSDFEGHMVSSGTMTAAEFTDVALFISSVTSPAVGTMAATEAPDVSDFEVRTPNVGTLAAVEAPDVAVFMPQPLAPVVVYTPPGMVGGGGPDHVQPRTRTVSDHRTAISARLTRKEMELIIAALPDKDRMEMLQNLDDEDVAFLLENSVP